MSATQPISSAGGSGGGSPPNAAPPAPGAGDFDRRLVDIATVAERLGVNVRYVRRLVAEDAIPYIKLRHLLRFELKAIDRWIDNCRRGGHHGQPQSPISHDRSWPPTRP